MRQDKLIVDEYYWVRSGGGDWFVANHTPQAAGGWTNFDTWEDFNHEITEWVYIRKPTIEDVVSNF
jgi:hypothetical protein